MYHHAHTRSLFIGAFNVAGDVLARAGLARPLPDDEAMLAEARARTNLDDFGDNSFRAPLRRLLRACREEAALNYFGRVATYSGTLQLLVNRLRLRAYRKRHPDIANVEIRRPIFIVGLPRSGTTLLHGLLAQDPANRAPETWETMHPPPPIVPARYGGNPWLAKAERQLRWFQRIAPGFKKIHVVDARAPQECIAITAHTFASAQFHTTYHVPTYQAWLDTYDHAPCYRFHRHFLQHLQFARPTARWVLKAPAHLFNLDALLAEYPDALIVQTHRDPLRVLPSVASLIAALQAIFGETVDPLGIGREVAHRWAEGVGRAMRFRAAAGAARAQFVDVRYDELSRDPLATVARIYRRMDRPLGDEARARMARYLTENRKAKYGVHAYRLSDFGLVPEREAARFRSYCAHHGIDSGAPTPERPAL